MQLGALPIFASDSRFSAVWLRRQVGGDGGGGKGGGGEGGVGGDGKAGGVVEDAGAVYDE